MNEPEIICVGAAHWDLIARAAVPLGAGRDAPGAILRRPGGVAANVAMGLARRGRRVGLLSAVGRGPMGDALIVALANAGVSCAAMVRTEAATAAYVAVEDADGELAGAVADITNLWEPALLARLRGPRDWLLHLPDDAGDRYASPIFFDASLPEPALAAMPLCATRAGFSRIANATSTALAPRLRPFLAPAPRPPLDGLYASRAEAEALLDQPFASALEAARALAPRLGPLGAVVTDGPRPAASAREGAQVELEVPAAPGAKSVTGAGDALVAAHLDAVLAGAAPDAALRAGLAAAAAHISGDAP